MREFSGKSALEHRSGFQFGLKALGSQNCDMIYQRITVLDSPDPEDMSQFEGAEQRDAGGVSELENRSPDSAGGGQNNKPSTKAPPTPDDDDDISEYSRVRLLTQAAIKWNKEDCPSLLYLSSQGLKVTFAGPKLTYRGDYKGWAVRANKPFASHPAPGEFRYFEIEVINGGERK